MSSGLQPVSVQASTSGSWVQVQMLLEYWPPFLERPIKRKRHQLLSWMEKVGEDEDLLGEPRETAGSG